MSFLENSPARRRERLERYVRPVQEFVHTEAASGIVLLVGALIALAWANSPWSHGYHELLDRRLSFDVGFYALSKPLHAVVNDAAMTVFFFVVGLEIKREMSVGQLRGARRIVVPLCAAIGGIVVPAAIFLALVHDPALRHGWGIPIATDIAFALGVMALLGPRVGRSLKALLLAIAIFDDIAAILVIAAFYTDAVVVGPLLFAVLMLVVAWGAQQIGVWYVPVYVLLGVLAWFGVLESGVHPTIVGVAFGLLTPWRAWHGTEAFIDRAGWLLGIIRETEHAEGRDGVDEERAATLLDLRELATESVAPLDRLERELHLLVAFGIVPLFAFANAGVSLAPSALSDAATSSVTRAIVLALVIGKPAGILLGTWLVVRAGARLPAGVHWRSIAAVGVVGGIGFTVSLFITELAYADAALLEQAKLGIIVASAVAGIAGYAVLHLAGGVRRAPSG
jgi:NhaA family Na+:H+ antiporter